MLYEFEIMDIINFNGCSTFLQDQKNDKRRKILQ